MRSPKEVADSRKEAHGEATDSLELIAGLWSEYLGIEIAPHEVAEMMIILKIARSKNGQPTMEHYEDIQGYAHIANEATK